MNTAVDTLERPAIAATEKPIHESILATIGRAASPGLYDFTGQLIIETKIPKGHQAIKDAWMALMSDMGVNDDGWGVIAKMDAGIAAEAAEPKDGSADG